MSKSALMLFGLSALILIFHVLSYPFVTDDAYISFRYSWNLAYHGELTFNLGERVEGYTNFLWTVIMALFLTWGVPPEIASRALGLIAGLAVLAMTFVLSRLCLNDRNPCWAAIAPLLLALWPSFAVWCSGGLETQLFTAFVVAGLLVQLSERRSASRLMIAGLLMALASMTRPEGIFFFSALLAYRLWRNTFRGEGRTFSKAETVFVSGFAVPFLLFFSWRYLYYGHLFPNTFYAKTTTGNRIETITRWGLPYIYDAFGENQFFLLLPLLVFLVPPIARRLNVEGNEPVNGSFGRDLLSYAAVTSLIYVGYVVAVGGDFMTLGRFLVPILPFFALLVAAGVSNVAHFLLAKRNWYRRLAVAGLVLLPLILTANSYRVHKDQMSLRYYRWGLDTVAYLKKFSEDRIKIGTWMREHFPADTYLAVAGAGAVVYASRLKTLDVLGLTDERIAHQAGPQSAGRPGHAKSASQHYLLEEKPDLMCQWAKRGPSRYRASESKERYWRDRGYHWVCLDPEGLEPTYYCCLKRMDKTLGPFSAELGW